LEQEIETNLKLSEFSDDDMDIEYECLIENTITHTSFLASNQNTFSLRNPNTWKNTVNSIPQSDWPISVSQAPLLDLNSKCEFHSFPFIQKLPMDQSNTANSMPEAHLDNPGDLSGGDLNLSDSDSASQSSDEPITTRRRTLSMVIDESDEEM
jgi:hypothetical protein